MEASNNEPDKPTRHTLKSQGSVRSVPVIGAHELGSLRLHQGLEAENGPKESTGDLLKSKSSAPTVPVPPSNVRGPLRIHQVDGSTSTESSTFSGIKGEESDDGSPPPLSKPEKGKGKAVSWAPQTSTSNSNRHEADAVLSDTPTHRMGGGDLIIFLDLPEPFTIGYDTISFTAKQFKGLRDVPPGMHLLWVAHPNGFSTRCGVWIAGSSTGDRVHVLQWDKFNEVLGEASRAETQIQAVGVDDALYRSLAPYHDPAFANEEALSQPSAAVSTRALQAWDQLISKISPDVLDRITPHQGDADWVVHTADRVHGSVVIPAEFELDRRVSGTAYLQSRELNFSFLQQSRTFSTDQIGKDRTRKATDATPYIELLLNNISKPLTEDDLVGEFQFAYIVGSHLGNDGCMQQWWHMLLKLILRAYVLPNGRPTLACSFLQTLAAQLSHSAEFMESSALEQSEGNARELRLALIKYKKRLDEMCSDSDSEADSSGNGPIATATALAKVETVVAGPPLDWDLNSESYLRRGKARLEDGDEVEVEMTELQEEDERGEYAPEVVEFDESGRQKDLVSWSN